MNREYWENRYISKNAKWNAGTITTPLKDYIDQLEDKNLRILVLGIGHGHELLYLHRQGFVNSYGIDLTDIAVKETVLEHSDFPMNSVIIEDLFHHVGEYDVIIEQTFFCSLPRELRSTYVSKINQLLSEKGKLVGVLFDCEFDTTEPPFGGSKEEYDQLFRNKMKIKVLEKAYNSIKPRADREVFINIEKQQQHD